MIGRVTRRMLPHLSEVPHLHVNRPKSFLNFQSGEVSWKIKRLHFAIITSFPWYIHSLALALDQSARSKPLSYSKKGRG